MRKVVLGTTLLLFSCSPGEEAVPFLSVATFQPVASFGSLESSASSLVLSTPRPARFSPGGDLVAVADRAEPVLRIFNLQDSEPFGFGRIGEGPGELGRIDGLEFLDDSTLVVLSRGRLERFHVDGTWLSGVTFDSIGVRLEGLVRGCGRLFGVGAMATQNLDSVPWLHDLDPVSGVIIGSRVHVTPTDRRFHGRFSGLGGDPGGVSVWRRDEHAGHFVDCGGEEKRWGLAGPAAEGSHPTAGLLVLPDTLFQGTSLRGGRLYSASSFENRAGERVTRFRSHFSEEGECQAVDVGGSFLLFDANESHFLVGSMRGLHPTIEVHAWSDFDSVAGSVRCGT